MTLLFRLPFLLLVCFVFCGWGYNGHKIINKKTVLSFPAEMAPFQAWEQQLEAHASDADYRKGSDPAEGPKHYIDIDNYPEFISNGYISQDLDSLIALHGYSFVSEQGFLPWAIIAAYDSLVQTFTRRDWNKAVLFAADLGHYLGDAHMPLHITRNYNGGYTGQQGIHSRYESGLIDRYYTQMVYAPDTARIIGNVPDYVFQLIYLNYLFVDSVLTADLAAKSFAGNTYSDLYYQKFWESGSRFTTYLFRSSSEALGCMIYSAWVSAGRPYEVSFAEAETDIPASFTLYQNFPNPFNPVTTISYQVPQSCYLTISVYNITGELIARPVDRFHEPGRYLFDFHAESLPSGIYLFTASAGAERYVRKMTILK